MTELRDQVQQSLGQAYTIDRELGGGGMSRVFVAHDANLRRDVVVKVLPPELVAGVNVERFRREILVAAGLQHPHIVPVLSSGETDGVPWFTMPLVQGESLRDRLKRGPLPLPEALSILREVAKALAYAHERGVVHRDIKPDNVLITGGTAVVTDFGIAKALSASRTDEHPTATRGSLTQMGVSIGTPMYMSPEQAAADPDTDARADLYSFGCMAYELLTGHPPFHGMPPQKLLAAHMSERAKNVAELRRDTPPLVAELVMRCLEKDPSNRPASAADVVKVLELASTTSSGSAAAASAVLLGSHISMRIALLLWAIVSGATWILAKAAIVGIGLPSWVLPGAMIVAGLGLPAILVTAFVQKVARKALIETPTLTPGGGTAPQGTIATIAMKASPHVSWKRTWRGGAFAFGAFVLIVGVFMVLRALGIGPAGSLLAAGRISAREPLLVTDFAVRGTDSTVAAVVTEALRASLGQSPTVTLVSPATVASALDRMQRPKNSRLDLPLARDLAQREGIKAIVDGDVTSLGGGYVVAVRLVTADSGRILASEQQAANGPKELIATVDAIGRELRGKLGESLRSVQNAPALESVTTPSMDALRAYSEGAREYDRGGDYNRAIARLSDATRIDSGFAMAWRKLGMVYSSMGYPQATVDSVLRQAFKFRDRLSQRERLLTEDGYYQLGPGRDRARATHALEQLLALGDSNAAANNLGVLAITRRDWKGAETMYRMALKTNPDLGIGYTNLAHAVANQGRFAEANKTLDDAEKRNPTPGMRARAEMSRALVAVASGDYERAGAVLDSAMAAGLPISFNATDGVAIIDGIRGRFGRAPRMLAKASTVPGFEPLTDSIYLAQLDIGAGRPDRAVKRIDGALAARPLSKIPLANRDYFDVAAIYARAGHPERARTIMAERAAAVHDTAQLRDEMKYERWVNGHIAVAENRPLDGVREFQKGDSLPDGPAVQCDACLYQEVGRAYDVAQQPDSAIHYYEKSFATPNTNRWNGDIWYRAIDMRRLGELYEARRDFTNAAKWYRAFVDLWKDADPDLQPQVTDVKQRLARLAKVTG